MHSVIHCLSFLYYFLHPLFFPFTYIFASFSLFLSLFVCAFFQPFLISFSSSSWPLVFCRLFFSPLSIRETNLKVRQSLTVTGDLGEDIEKLSDFNGKTPLSCYHVRLSAQRSIAATQGKAYWSQITENIFNFSCNYIL